MTMQKQESSLTYTINIYRQDWLMNTDTFVFGSYIADHKTLDYIPNAEYILAYARNDEWSMNSA